MYKHIIMALNDGIEAVRQRLFERLFDMWKYPVAYARLYVVFQAYGIEVTAEEQQVFDKMQRVCDSVMDHDILRMDFGVLCMYEAKQGTSASSTLQEREALSHKIFDYFTQRVNSQVNRLLFTSKTCSVCFERKETSFKCSVCQNNFARYCSKACQKQDWPNHKVFCSHLKEAKHIVKELVHLRE